MSIADAAASWIPLALVLGMTTTLVGFMRLWAIPLAIGTAMAATVVWSGWSPLHPGFGLIIWPVGSVVSLITASAPEGDQEEEDGEGKDV